MSFEARRVQLETIALPPPHNPSDSGSPAESGFRGWNTPPRAIPPSSRHGPLHSARLHSLLLATGAEWRR